MSVTTFNIVDFISDNIIPELLDSNTVTGITEITGGYTIATSDLFDLVDGGAIEISGVTGFNAKYEISNLTAISFDIVRIFSEQLGLKKIDTGIAIPSLDSSSFWTSGTPVFYSGRPDKVNIKTNMYDRKLRNYPQIVWFRSLGEEEQYSRNDVGFYNFTANNQKMGFLIPLNSNWTEEEYEANSFDTMRKLALQFISKLDGYDEIKAIDDRKEISLFENWTLNPYYALAISNSGKDTFDYRATGVVLTFNLEIRNAGKICY